jgi:hypothetical protein
MIILKNKNKLIVFRWSGNVFYFKEKRKMKQDRKSTYGVILKRFRITVFAVERLEVLHIRVFYRTLSNLASNVHAPYYIVICGLSSLTMLLISDVFVLLLSGCTRISTPGTRFHINSYLLSWGSLLSHQCPAEICTTVFLLPL